MPETYSCLVNSKTRSTSILEPAPTMQPPKACLIKTFSSQNLIATLISTGCTQPGGAGQDNCSIATVKADRNNNVFAVGFFSDTVDFDPGPATAAYAISSNSIRAFTLKLNSFGNLLWVKTFSGDSNFSEPKKMVLDDSANVYSVGWFSGKTDFDPGPDSMILDKSANVRVYIHKLDSNGNFRWLKGMKSYSSVDAQDMVIDKAQNLIISGIYEHMFHYDSNQLVDDDNPHFLPGSFILKTDRNGNALWLANTGSRGWHGLDQVLSVDTIGNVYLTGYIRDSADIDPNKGKRRISPVTDTLGWKQDMYLACYNPDGSLAWGSNFPAHHYQYPACMHVDKGNNLLVAGGFTVVMDADPNTPVYNISSGQNHFTLNSFIVKYGLCSGPISRNNVNACDSFSFNGYTRTKNGTYYQRFPTSGCDSTAIIDLSIKSADATVTKDSVFLMAKSPTGSYEWLDCSNGMTPVTGATGWIFYPPKTSSYALRITDNGCTTVSPCYHMIGTGIGEKEPFNSLSYYPNPTTGEVNIDYGWEPDGVDIEITDLSGRLLYSRTTKGVRNTILRLDGPAGLYFVRLTTSAGLTKTLKLVKQ
jgi:hypothetical protein